MFWESELPASDDAPTVAFALAPETLRESSLSLSFRPISSTACPADTSTRSPTITSMTMVLVSIVLAGEALPACSCSFLCSVCSCSCFSMLASSDQSRQALQLGRVLARDVHRQGHHVLGEEYSLPPHHFAQDFCIAVVRVEHEPEGDCLGGRVVRAAAAQLPVRGDALRADAAAVLAADSGWSRCQAEVALPDVRMLLLDFLFEGIVPFREIFHRGHGIIEGDAAQRLAVFRRPRGDHDGDGVILVRDLAQFREERLDGHRGRGDLARVRLVEAGRASAAEGYPPLGDAAGRGIHHAGERAHLVLVERNKDRGEDEQWDENGRCG